MTRRTLPPLSVAPAFAQFLTALAAEQAVYLVGGWLRDALRGAPAQDADFATDAGAPVVRALAARQGLKIFADKVAEQHGTYRMTTGAPHEVLDLATLRADVAREGARHARVAFTDDIALDLARRDLTINGMAAVYPFASPCVGDIIDPFGGQKDLAAKQLRLIGAPTKRLEEDPLRLLRVARFSALGEGWHIAPNTACAMRKARPLLKNVSFERVRDEIKKGLGLSRPDKLWQSMRKAGVLAHVWPMPTGFCVKRGIAALRQAPHVTPAPMLRLAAFVIAGARPPAHTTRGSTPAAWQQHCAAQARLVWLRLRAANSEALMLESIAAAFAWQPQHLRGAGLAAWLLTYGDAPIRACRTVGHVLVRAKLTPKAPLDALWRRVEDMLQGRAVPTLQDLAINGETLARLGLVDEGPKMGVMLRALLHLGLEKGIWRDPAAMEQQAMQWANARGHT